MYPIKYGNLHERQKMSADTLKYRMALALLETAIDVDRIENLQYCVHCNSSAILDSADRTIHEIPHTADCITVEAAQWLVSIGAA